MLIIKILKTQHYLNKEENTINKKAVLTAAAIVISLGMSSCNVSPVESTVAHITEVDERPVTLYYPEISGPDNIAAEENEDKETTAIYEKVTEESLRLTKTLPDTSVKPEEVISCSALELKETHPEEAASAIKNAAKAGDDISEQAVNQEDTQQTEEGEPAKQPVEFTDAEKKMIAKVVYAEARGECFDGQVAVAQVVINRYECGRYGSTLKRVVYSRAQFAVSKRFSAPCMEAVEYAIQNMPYPADMYYFRVSKSKRWRNFVYYNRIGNHSFYCGKK